MMRRVVPTRRRRSRQGFTLLELIVAIVIVGGIAGAATVSISQALRAKVRSEARQQAFARASVAIETVARDLENFVRDGDLYFAYVAIADNEQNDRAHDEILFFARSNRPARPTIEGIGEQAEGAEYEIQYRLLPRDPGIAQLRSERRNAGEILWKRQDPIPDEYPDAGGVAFPIAEGITSLSFEGFDGENWYPDWDSDRDGYPYAVRVSLSAVSPDGSVEAVVRKVVAFDRVPLPYTSVTAEEDEDEGEGAGGGGGR